MENVYSYSIEIPNSIFDIETEFGTTYIIVVSDHVPLRVCDTLP